MTATYFQMAFPEKEKQGKIRVCCCQMWDKAKVTINGNN